MSRFDPAPEVQSICPAAWAGADLGRYVAFCEQDWLDRSVADLFGFNAVALAQPGLEPLRNNRMPLRVCAGLASAGVLAQPQALPFASQSLDLLVLPHVLEFADSPHQVLREAERVLRPEGRLLILGFNPVSLWGLRRWLGPRRGYPWLGQFLRLARIKDWLALLGFEIVAGRMSCYAPPIDRAGWLRRWRFMEAAGDRWWALGGGVYMLHAVKRVQGMRLITPRLEKGWAKTPVLAPGASRMSERQK
jgi:SAM-dependent methyltransferase